MWRHRESRAIYSTESSFWHILERAANVLPTSAEHGGKENEINTSPFDSGIPSRRSGKESLEIEVKKWWHLLWELNITHIIVCSTRMLKVKLKILLIANNFALSKIYLHTWSKDLLLWFFYKERYGVLFIECGKSNLWSVISFVCFSSVNIIPDTTSEIGFQKL